MGVRLPSPRGRVPLCTRRAPAKRNEMGGRGFQKTILHRLALSPASLLPFAPTPRPRPLARPTQLPCPPRRESHSHPATAHTLLTTMQPHLAAAARRPVPTTPAAPAGRRAGHAPAAARAAPAKAARDAAPAGSLADMLSRLPACIVAAAAAAALTVRETREEGEFARPQCDVGLARPGRPPNLSPPRRSLPLRAVVRRPARPGGLALRRRTGSRRKGPGQRPAQPVLVARGELAMRER